MKRFFGFIIKSLLSIIALCVFLLWFLGFFDTLYIIEREEGPYKLIYEQVGLFEQTKTVQNEIFNNLHDIGITPDKTFSIYYSDFDSTMLDITGCIIEEKDFKEVEIYKDLFKIHEMKKEIRIVADFPYKNTFSEVGGAYRIEKAMDVFCSENSYKLMPIIEMTDAKQERIFYVMDIKHKY